MTDDGLKLLDSEMKLLEKSRDVPLLERLDQCKYIIKKLASSGRSLTMSVPPQYDDHDIYLLQTLKDAATIIEAFMDDYNEMPDRIQQKLDIRV